MKITRFHVFEAFYTIMVFQLLFYAALTSLLVILDPLWVILTHPQEISDGLFTTSTIIAEVVGYGTLGYIWLSMLPNIYHRTISEHVGIIITNSSAGSTPSESQPFSYTGLSKPCLIGSLIPVATVLIYSLLCRFDPQRQFLYTACVTTFVTTCCIMALIATWLMLAAIWYHKRHYTYIYCQLPKAASPVER